ncbi:MAG TPA: hypothetical protein VFV98_14280 [Vicinamibacterales bacterium]|nr:hypothetical protein [Vicinamibacterales bacterium]
MSTRNHATLVLIGLLLALPTAAAAQSSPAPPRVSFGAGIGVAVPAYEDMNATPPAWEADVRLALTKHLLFEGVIGEWRHSETHVSHNLPASGGVIGRLEETTTRRERTMQANLLATGTQGRVRFSGGGGIGFLQYHRQFRQELTECSPQVSCGAHESPFSSSSTTVQGVGGIDVRLVGGLAAYGQVRLTIPVPDPSGGGVRFMTGVRWGFGK